MTLLLVYLAIALGFSFLCSILEAVLLSMTPGFVTARAQKGDRIGYQLKRFKQDIDRPLAAVLTLNTFAHTIGAAGVGAAAADTFGDQYLAIVSVVVTVLILFASEIIPKTIGAVYWRQLAVPTTRLLVILCWILAPFIWLSQLLTRLLRPRNGHGSLLSRADIGVLATQGYRDGALRAAEQAIISNLMAFEGKTAEGIMLSHDKIITLPQNAPLTALRQQEASLHVSRIPLVDGDEMNNYIFKDDVMVAMLKGHADRQLQAFARPLVRVKASTALLDLYHTLAERSEHIAVVVNDDDQVIGLVTMEDLIESLLGLAITDESDHARERAQALEAV